MITNKEQWLKTAETYISLWQCQKAGEPFFTHSSLLWPLQKNGNSFMLKVVNQYDDEANAAEILRFFSGSSSVNLIESENNVLLLERIVTDGGRETLEDLVLAGKDDKATEIICEVITHLHRDTQSKVIPNDLIPFQSRSDDMRRHIALGRVKVSDRDIFLQAQNLFLELHEEFCDSYRPLHGDIHHNNVLYSDKRGWLAIDPKGILGPPAYEYANSLCNPYPHQETVANISRMDRQASIMAEISGIKKETILKFAFLHACQCGAWSLHEPDQRYWMKCAFTAKSFF